MSGFGAGLGELVGFGLLMGRGGGALEGGSGAWADADAEASALASGEVEATVLASVVSCSAVPVVVGDALMVASPVAGALVVVATSLACPLVPCRIVMIATATRTITASAAKATAAREVDCCRNMRCQLVEVTARTRSSSSSFGLRIVADMSDGTAGERSVCHAPLTALSLNSERCSIFNVRSALAAAGLLLECAASATANAPTLS
jgi:hypothetical protein